MSGMVMTPFNWNDHAPGWAFPFADLRSAGHRKRRSFNLVLRPTYQLFQWLLAEGQRGQPHMNPSFNLVMQMSSGGR